MATRIAISKSNRFRIFDRDGFACRYCGESPPNVKLVIDHLIPVVDGGYNDDANLVTSCEPCNQGKGRKPISDKQPEAVSLCRSQELLEQIDAAKLTQQATDARQCLRQQWCHHWENITGLDLALKATITSLCRLCLEFGPELLFGWLDSAESATGNSPAAWDYRERDMMKYVHGCARNVREERR